jgi:hypothetical protein
MAKKKKKSPAAAPRKPSPKKAASAGESPAPHAGPRRSIFIDVENTSNEAELARVLDELKIDPQHGVTQVSAIGNWRLVGQKLGRTLAERGVVLVHSAPAARVRDWSDLWIAVQAGIWLGRARAGDIIEIVSHDKAFDAVGDAAAQLGVIFRRITYRASASRAELADSLAQSDEPQAPRGNRRRRGGRSGRGSAPLAQTPQNKARLPPIAAPARAPVAETPAGEIKAATPQVLTETVARLASASPLRYTTLNALTLALQAAGFHRPPGSPRLVTRLHQIKSIEVMPNGKIRLREPTDAPVPAEPSAEVLATTPNVRPRRRRRRGGGQGAANPPAAPVP